MKKLAGTSQVTNLFLDIHDIGELLLDLVWQRNFISKHIVPAIPAVRHVRFFDEIEWDREGDDKGGKGDSIKHSVWTPFIPALHRPTVRLMLLTTRPTSPRLHPNILNRVPYNWRPNLWYTNGVPLFVNDVEGCLGGLFSESPFGDEYIQRLELEVRKRLRL